jgi:hypothetical protein
MKFAHHDLQIELEDDWWDEAGMAGFSPTSRAYRTHPSFSATGEPILEVSIAEVAPAPRLIGIFRDSEDGIPARERVLKILRGFRLDEAIPPVQVVESKPGSTYRYKLTDGAHRFYCALASGFTLVPTLKGFDWETVRFPN